MREDLHNDDPVSSGDFVPHIPAAHGWQTMEWLLNTHLPAQTRRGALVVFIAQVVTVAAVFLFAALPVQDSFYKMAYLAQQQPAPGGTPHSVPVTSLATVQAALPSRSFTALPAALLPVATLPAIADRWSVALPDSSTILPHFSPDTCIAGTAPGSAVKKDKAVKWQLLAGAGMNIATLGETQHLAPYPTVEARFFINKRMYVAAGLAIWSPVAMNKETVEKTVTFEQPVNDMKLYRIMRNYKRAVYTDIPVTAGIALNKHFSAAMGMQFSHLQKVVVNRYSQAYDERMRQVSSLMAQGQDLVVAPNAVVSAGHPEIKVPENDYRYLAAIEYQVQKWHFSCQYQHSFSTAPNRILSLKIQYRLK